MRKAPYQRSGPIYSGAITALGIIFPPPFETYRSFASGCGNVASRQQQLQRLKAAGGPANCAQRNSCGVEARHANRGRQLPPFDLDAELDAVNRLADECAQKQAALDADAAAIRAEDVKTRP
jgi:hypothetical protein